METKTCSSCNEEKTLDKFSKGRKCKKCYNEWHNNYYHTKNKQKHIDTIKEQNKNNKMANRVKFLDFMKGKCCAHCGEDDIVVLEFDHIDPSTKKNTVSNLLGQGSYTPWKTIKEEIDKCQILCANCHRRKTAKQLKHWKNDLKETAYRT